MEAIEKVARAIQAERGYTTKALPDDALWLAVPKDQAFAEAGAAIRAYQEALMPSYFRADERNPQPELRYHRAQQLTAHIMNVLSKHICDHDGRENHRDAASKLFELFYESGADIITDADRAAAGLMPRSKYGITKEEMAAMEARRMSLLLAPAPPMFIPNEQLDDGASK